MIIVVPDPRDTKIRMLTVPGGTWERGEQQTTQNQTSWAPGKGNKTKQRGG